MFGSARTRAGIVVAAVVVCSLLVGACLSTFASHAGRSRDGVGNGLPQGDRVIEHQQQPRALSVGIIAPKIRLATRPLSSHSHFRPPTQLQPLPTPNRQSQIETEEAQLGRIEAMVEARIQVLGPVSGKSGSGASAAVPVPIASPPPIMSQSQLDAAVQKLSNNKNAAVNGLAGAVEKMKKLKQEENELHKELGAVLGKITSLNVATSERILVPDGMGGDQEEVIVTRPVGGKAVAKVLNGQDSAVVAALNQASGGEGYINAASPPFASHESASGNDGLGGSQLPLSQQSFLSEPLAAGKIVKGMAPKVHDDDGLGGSVRSAVAAVTNAGPRKLRPFRTKDVRMDGVGGSGKQLFHRRSNQHLTKTRFMRKVMNNDGVGGDKRYRESRNLRKVPRNRIHSWARDCGDGVGGKAIWCARLIEGAASAKGSSSLAVATRISIKAALIAHDIAAKERAGAVHRRRSGGGAAGSSSASGSADQDSQDDDDGDDGGDGMGGSGNENWGGGGGGTDGGYGYSGGGADGGYGGYGSGGYNAEGGDGSGAGYSGGNYAGNSDTDSGGDAAQQAASGSGNVDTEQVGDSVVSNPKQDAEPEDNSQNSISPSDSGSNEAQAQPVDNSDNVPNDSAVESGGSSDTSQQVDNSQSNTASPPQAANPPAKPASVTPGKKK